MNSTDTIFVLGKEDASAVSALEAQCFPSFWTKEEYEPLLDTRMTIDAPDAAAHLVAADISVFGIFSSNALIAYVSVRVIGNEAEIYNIAVVESQRGKGMATQLLHAVLVLAQKAGLEQIFLEVRAGNKPAKALYSTAGFLLSGRRKAYYDDGEDAELMVYHLDNNNL